MRMLTLLALTALFIAPLACRADFNPDKIPELATAPIYRDSSQPIGKRVDDLVSRMSLREKASQMMNKSVEIPRLGIPAYEWWSEGLHGVGRNGIATVYPQAIGLGATWDAPLIHDVATTISTEARAKYNEALRLNGKTARFSGLTYWSPNVNLFRDPRWGRGQETYGEDPFLTGRIGVAFVTGLQGNDPKYFKVISTPKHFAVHSGPEPERHRFNAVPPERDFYESYLPHFEACIREGHAYSIMGAYNRTYGEPCCASTLLLDTILRKTWGFKGYVTSDCGAIDDIFANHHVVNTPQEAAALAVKAGCDLECGYIYGHLPEAVEQGLITEAQIDISVKRLMEAKFRLGMFDPIEKVAYAQIPISEVDSPAHKEQAIRTARESMVLLKNDGTLPLKSSIRRILVVGPNADSVPVLYGNYNGDASRPVTILEGIKEVAPRDCRIDYMKGCELTQPLVSTPVPAENLTSDGKSGLKGEYFSNRDLSGTPAVTRQDATVDFNWSGRSPADGLPTTNFSVRWTGDLNAPKDGEYTLAVRGDDGYRLSVDGKIVAEDWTTHPASMKSAKVALSAIKPAHIVLEYFQGEGEATVSLMWDADANSPQQRLIAAAKAADAVIFVGGISAELEGEEMYVPYEGFKGGDRTKIEMPTVQTDLMRALHSAGKPVILVNCSGSAVAMPWEAQNLPAILQAWYPGQAGGAVADVLFGKYNPAGRLPVTFYKSTSDLPPFEDYAMKNRTYRYFTGKPQWAFGHGLSYAKFRYGNVKLSKTTAGAKDTITVSCYVKNIGSMDGDEVVQVYAADRFSPEPRPLESLKGFARVHIKKGQTAKVQIPLKISNLRYWDIAKKKYVVYPGSYEIRVGAASDDIRLRTRVVVK
jgi:beta-glucosidase